MLKNRLAPLALALSIATAADGASLTPPNLVAATSLNNPDLLLVWPYAAGGPLEQMSWSVFKGQVASGLAGSFLVPSNNLSDVGNPTIVRTNLGLTLGTSGASLCLLNSACNWSALQSFAASTTGGASINIAPGVAPTSPNNGDMWTTSGGFFTQVNGVTEQLAPFKTGTIAATLAYATPGTSSFSYATQSGDYVCVAGMVSGWARVQFTPTNGNASGILFWTNPPYQPNTNGSDTNAGIGPPIGFSGGWSTVTAVYTLGAPYGANQLAFVNNQGTTLNYITTSNSTTGTSKEMVWEFSYLTSSC